jgi:precorrin-6A/cobalt-precorrin-6A reductase
MILLLGGTRETDLLAQQFAEAGYKVLVSTTTDLPQNLEMRPGVKRRSGPLDERGMALIIITRNIQAIVDCTHPYTVKVRSTARLAAKAAGIPYFIYLRPEGITLEENVVFAGSHEEAADIAASFCRPVLLTTGSKKLESYVQACRKSGVDLVVRVSPETDSIKACTTAGIDWKFIVAGRGPFSVEKNQKTLKRFRIGVLVTKDSGKAGGVLEKLQAARLEDCRVVVVRRPPKPLGNVFEDLADLVADVIATVSKE